MQANFWEPCLHAHKGCSETHHRAANIQRRAPKQVPQVEWMNIRFIPGVHMVVLSVKVGKMSCHEYKGYEWQCLITQSPTQQHSEP